MTVKDLQKLLATLPLDYKVEISAEGLSGLLDAESVFVSDMAHQVVLNATGDPFPNRRDLVPIGERLTTELMQQAPAWALTAA